MGGWGPLSEGGGQGDAVGYKPASLGLLALIQGGLFVPVTHAWLLFSPE